MQNTYVGSSVDEPSFVDLLGGAEDCNLVIDDHNDHWSQTHSGCRG